MTKLSAEQEATIREWASRGESLNDIHKRIRDELGLTMTYMEARLLVADLEVSLQDKNPPVPPKVDPETPEGEETVPETGGKAPDKVKVTVDSIAKPRSLVSGQVAFSDGTSAGWYLDQMGRLGLDVADPAYRPSEADVMAFQRELEQELQRAGF